MKKSIKSPFIKTLVALFIIGLNCAFAFSFRNMTLDFIDISDTHISVDRADTTYKALSSSSALLSDAIEQINSIKGLDFVLFNGDLVDSSTNKNWEQFYKVVSELRYPHLNCFGNHDLATGMDEDDVLNIVKSHNRNYIFDKTYYAISPKSDYKIIVLDSIVKDKNTANGELSAEQLAFLDSEIASSPDKVIVIAMHHPAIEPFSSMEHALINENAFNEILLKYNNPILVLTGHYHATKIRNIGNIVYVSTPSLVTYPMAFRHIRITNYKDRVRYEFAFLNTRLDDVKEANRQSVISYGTLAGIETDRNREIVFKKRNAKSANYKRNKIEKANKSAKVSKRELKKLTKPTAPKVKPVRKKRFKKIATPKE